MIGKVCERRVSIRLNAIEKKIYPILTHALSPSMRFPRHYVIVEAEQPAQLSAPDHHLFQHVHSHYHASSSFPHLP